MDVYTSTSQTTASATTCIFPFSQLSFLLYCFRDTAIKSKRDTRNPDKEFWFSLLGPGTLFLSLEHNEGIKFGRSECCLLSLSL